MGRGGLLFEWVRPSGFVDTVRKGRIEPKLEYLSRGDPLDRAEKSGDRTTFFGGQKVKEKGEGVHQKGTRLNGKWDVPRSETISLRTPRFEILASQGPLFHVSEARSHRTSGKKAPVWNLVITRKSLSV